MRFSSLPRIWVCYLAHRLALIDRPHLPFSRHFPGKLRPRRESRKIFSRGRISWLQPRTAFVNANEPGLLSLHPFPFRRFAVRGRAVIIRTVVACRPALSTALWWPCRSSMPYWALRPTLSTTAGKVALVSRKTHGISLRSRKLSRELRNSRIRETHVGRSKRGRGISSSRTRPESRRTIPIASFCPHS